VSCNVSCLKHLNDVSVSSCLSLIQSVFARLVCRHLCLGECLSQKKSLDSITVFLRFNYHIHRFCAGGQTTTTTKTTTTTTTTTKQGTCRHNDFTPGAAPGKSLSIRLLSRRPYGRLWANMTSSTKPEVHKLFIVVRG